MSRWTFIVSDKVRAKLHAWINKAPDGMVVEFIEADRRTLAQNKKIHAMCTDVALQVEWNGAKRTVDDWKDIFTAALKSANSGLDVVPGINGGFVLLGLHTSQLNVSDAADLITLIEAFGAERGVKWSEPKSSDPHQEAA